MDQVDTDAQDVVTDIGAASTLTQGFWDPMMWESHLIPEARD